MTGEHKKEDTQKTRASLVTNLPVDSACFVRKGSKTANSESQDTGGFSKAPDFGKAI
jgi:hypothetical protein